MNYVKIILNKLKESDDPEFIENGVMQLLEIETKKAYKSGWQDSEYSVILDSEKGAKIWWKQRFMYE